MRWISRIACLLIGLFAVSAQGASSLTIDDFSAADPWRAIGSSPAAKSVPGGLLLRCPFSQDTDRVYWDRDVRLDLSAYTSFHLDISCDQPQALRGMAIYFKSGNGWYIWNKPLREPGRQRLILSRDQFSVEGKPSGWNKIDRVRLSPWRGTAVDAKIVMHSLKAQKDGLVIIPATLSTADAGERAMSKRLAERLAKWLDRLGVSHTIMSEEEAARGGLKNARLAILPLNPNPPANLLIALDAFAVRGGKTMVCFSASEELAKIMHVKLGAYQTSEEPGRWSSMVFSDAAKLRLPERVYQSSWSIRPVLPADSSGWVLARWANAKGEKLNDPAWVATDRGLWFSHVLLEDDTFKKQEMLLSLLGRYSGAVWFEAAKRARASAGKVDQFASYEAANAGISKLAPSSRNPDRVIDLLITAEQRRGEMEVAFKSEKFADSVTYARAMNLALIEAYSLCQQGRKGELRAVWDHDGTGWFPGDWNRTAKILADSGINAVFANLQWAGLAHYESSVLPESNTRRLYGDQLDASLKAARANGLQLHVWKICWNIEQAPDDFKARMRKEGRVLKTAGGAPTLWLDPSIPANVELELAALKEVARNYAVDGIHLDYIRFPPGAAFKGNKAQAINAFVKKAHEAVKAIRPDIKLTAAVWGAYPACITSVGQDWAAWLKAGWVDYVCPMNYTTDLYEFNALTQKQLALPGARGRIIPGIGVTAAESQLTPDHVIEQILAARRAGVPGFVLFDLNPTLRDETLPMLSLGITRED